MWFGLLISEQTDIWTSGAASSQLKSRPCSLQVPAPDCCTPANLYPGPNIDRLADSLASISCGYNKAKDFALVDVVAETGLKAWYLQPNIVSHIGAYSSIRPGVNVAPWRLRNITRQSVSGSNRYGAVSNIKIEPVSCPRLDRMWGRPHSHPAERRGQRHTAKDEKYSDLIISIYHSEASVHLGIDPVKVEQTLSVKLLQPARPGQVEGQLPQLPQIEPWTKKRTVLRVLTNESLLLPFGIFLRRWKHQRHVRYLKENKLLIFNIKTKYCMFCYCSERDLRELEVRMD